MVSSSGYSLLAASSSPLSQYAPTPTMVAHHRATSSTPAAVVMLDPTAKDVPLATPAMLEVSVSSCTY